ncbi:MAG: hypothetical protein KZQ92_15625 [Candidatus Thiodiazotropha sp. (ex Lucinoma borealis)]|nr:hypothetical protein [Candidatus Thiodiazotropha sp. (ex Lucinoma borealis)]MCU7865394.1 hypothetical protein [Candidatus Thiodiazotropha sp. (ex Lucinoma borealis)]MCU7871068.1 hypothetical protein [Candidatus Thiodiazotropha sp. (ex Lucinoma borealis)]
MPRESGRNRGGELSKPKTANPNQQNFLHPNLLDQLNPKHPLLQLASEIDWSYFDSEFGPLYSHLGKPSKPIRLMVVASRYHSLVKRLRYWGRFLISGRLPPVW